MKKSLSFLLITIILLACLPLTGCGASGFTLVTKSHLAEHEDGNLQTQSRMLSKQKEIGDEDYICVLDKNFKDGTQIPSEKDGHPVVLLTALETFNESEATKIDVPDSVKIIDYLCAKGNDKLKSVTLPEGVTVVNSFCDCPELEDVDLDKPAEIEDSFSGCPKLKSEVFEVSENLDKCTVIMQKNEQYDYKEMKLKYTDIKETKDASDLAKPKGKWVEVDMYITGGIKNDYLNELVNEENMLLNGAAATKWHMTIPKDSKVQFSLIDGSLQPTECDLAVYYDVPADFKTCSAEVECVSDVTKQLASD